MKPIWVILKKDLIEYWVMPLIFILIPLLVFYLPINDDSQQAKIGIYGNAVKELSVEMKQIKNINRGIEQVKKGDLDVFYIPAQKIMYTTEQQKDKAKILLFLLSETTNRIKEISVESTIDSEYLYLPLLCVMSLFMTGFIGAPLAIINEKEEKTLQSLLWTPLTYKELILEKAIFGFIISFLASFIFLLLTGINGSILGIIIILLLSSILLSLIAQVFGILFSNTETMFGFLTPLLLIVLFLEVNSSFNNYYLTLPISRALYKLMVTKEIPIGEGILILNLSLLMIIVNGYILRRVIRNK